MPVPLCIDTVEMGVYFKIGIETTNKNIGKRSAFSFSVNVKCLFKYGVRERVSYTLITGGMLLLSVNCRLGSMLSRLMMIHSTPAKTLEDRWFIIPRDKGSTKRVIINIEPGFFSRE